MKYRARSSHITLMHTGIERAFEGRGLGSRFIAGVLDDLRARGLRVHPICPFVREFLGRHPEYTDLVWEKVSGH